MANIPIFGVTANGSPCPGEDGMFFHCENGAYDDPAIPLSNPQEVFTLRIPFDATDAMKYVRLIHSDVYSRHLSSKIREWEDRGFQGDLWATIFNTMVLGLHNRQGTPYMNSFIKNFEKYVWYLIVRDPILERLILNP